ncbi:hypothetical protein GY45DRAFT_1011312 [Cubamyces sp. BRFM 1775]|nr:hypothetical protein GY45DRAFT_1011312 [Cubamyces sp. BRFM 1775]
MEKPSIASTSSYQFGGECTIKARQGLLERQSLEDSTPIAHGEDLLASLHGRSIFSKPASAARSCSSTCTSSSSGAETPPLSASYRSSSSGSSQSSIDLGHLINILTNVMQPTSGVARARTRARARGMGYRRRIEQARMSRSSVYETIQEEASVLSSSPSSKHPTPQSIAKQVASPLVNNSVYIVDGDSESIYSGWNEENGIMTLRHYFAFRDEAHETVTESRHIRVDTPFSVFAVQFFHPPEGPAVMQAMLDHSRRNYGPLPPKLRHHRVRSRTSSRAPPYRLRSECSALSPEKPRSLPIHVFTDAPSKPFAAPAPEQPVLREMQHGANDQSSPAPALDGIKPFLPIHIELDASKHGECAFGLPSRLRVTSNTRGIALRWSK